MQGLEQLSGLKGGQLKPPLACILAAVCRSARQAMKDTGRAKPGSLSGAPSAAGRASLITPAQSRSLQVLPSDGAMRPAVSALLLNCDPGEAVPCMLMFASEAARSLRICLAYI